MAAVYFDHNATTPLDPRVRAAMLPWLGERWGNPSSIHGFGQAAREAVETARDEVAALLGARPLEIVFTGSGTEANNAVVLGIGALAAQRGHLVVSALEHPSVVEAAALLERAGMAVSRIAPGRDGTVSASELVAALREDTRLVCLMLAHNELGTLQPVAEVAAVCHAWGVPLLCDAVQAVGKLPVAVDELGADFVSVAAHKFHGPLGAAALWIREGRELPPLLLGGSQERRRRASTINVPAVVGFGRACALARAELAARTAHLGALRERFEAGLAARLPAAIVHGARAPRVPHTSHVAFPGLVAQTLMIRLDLAGWAVSTGAACSSGAVEPSPVLLAMGLSREEAVGSLRVSFGPANTPAQVDEFLEVLASEVGALRATAERVPA